MQAQSEEIVPRAGSAEPVDRAHECVCVGEVYGIEDRLGKAHPGSGPVATGRRGSADQSLQEPS